MNKIEKMKRYIELTKIDKKKSFPYNLQYDELVDLYRKAHFEGGFLFETISLAFDYGFAKGCRYEKNRMENK